MVEYCSLFNLFPSSWNNCYMKICHNISRKDEQFMQLCASAALIFSTCGKRKYAAVLIDEFGHIVGMGYNGGPKNYLHCEEGGCPRLMENSPSGSNYDNCIAVHAEANALLHSDYSARAKKIYINGPPCFSCAKLIVNSTIDSVYYMYDDSYKNWDQVKNFLLGSSIRVIEVGRGSF
jgi:dCMP deaminase